MDIKVWQCDRCDDEYRIREGLRIYFTVDRRMDPAGSMEDERESIDLCVNCLGALISKFTGQLPRDGDFYKRSQEYYSWARKKVKSTRKTYGS